jgi:xylan 1,4-beta-xylosidase
MAKKVLVVVVTLLGLVVLIVATNRAKMQQLIQRSPFLQKYSVQVIAALGSPDTSTVTAANNTVGEAHFSLTINAEKIIGNFPRFYVGHGMGTFHDGLIQAHNYEFFKLVGQINQQRPMMKFVNMKCIFMDKPRRGSNDYGAHVVQQDAAGKITYHWAIVDEVIDRILENDMKPIISLTFMPEALASDPNWINPWNRGIISVPKDYNQWRELNYQTILHLKQKYGAAELEKWYFEVWNEPDLFRFFWRKHPDQKQYPNRGDFDEYCKLYDYTVAGAIAAHPGIKIGGPGLAGDKLFVAKFLEHCFKGTNYVTGETGSRIDFVSRHHYGEIDERIVPGYVEFVERLREIAGPAFKNLDILITETGPSTHPKPWMNNHYMAAWIVREVDAFLQIGDKYGPDFLPDIVCFWGKPVSMNFGKQFGLATALGNIRLPDPKTLLKRPAFNAYHAVSLLGNERIELTGSGYENNLHGIATRTGDESIEILLYHLLEGDTFNNRRGKYTVDLQVIGPQNEYSLEYYLIDEKHSNSYNLWKKAGSPEYPAPEVIQQLQANDDLALAEPVSKILALNGVVNKQIVMQNNGVAFIRIYRSSDTTPPKKPESLATELNLAERSVHLSWNPPKMATAADKAASYLIYRNNELISRLFENQFNDPSFADDTNYEYEVFAVDQAGNLSEESALSRISVPRDQTPPELVQVETLNSETLLLTFNEPLDAACAIQTENYQINHLKIKSVTYDPDERMVRLTTAPHQSDQVYQLQLQNLRDLAQQPNLVNSRPIEYRYELVYEDRFEENTLGNYEFVHLEGPANQCRRFYDRQTQRIQVLVGDDTKIKFGHRLPSAQKGHFEITFAPLTKYPSGGVISLFLKQDDENYFKLFNTDGYGVGAIQKVIEGEVVDSLAFSHEFRQAQEYPLILDFSGNELRATAFGEAISISHNQTPLQIHRFEVELVQQDVFFDEILFRGE